MLGKGSFGSVTASGDKAIKQFANLNHLVAEVFVTKYCSFNSPYIVELKGCSFKNMTMSTTRWQCSLDKALESGTLTLAQKRSIHCCVLKALVHIEALHIVHADIKPANILVDSTYTKAVIADFGIASSSNSAKVRQTSPAYSIRQDKAKSHRTHDLFSFVLLSLNLFYKYRVPRKLSSREELRGIVKNIVTDKVLSSSLCNLIQDDELNCWTAKKVLKTLYEVSVQLPQPSFTLYVGASDKDTNLVMSYVNELIEKYSPKKTIRLKECAMLLFGMLSQSNPKLKMYLCTLVYVFICTFGCSKVVEREKRMSQNDIIKESGATLYDIIGCLNTILASNELVSLMYAP